MPLLPQEVLTGGNHIIGSRTNCVMDLAMMLCIGGGEPCIDVTIASIGCEAASSTIVARILTHT